MLEHLRLTAHKGLSSAELHNLGKLNVVCGKNNSGKSTLLEAISDVRKSIEGRAAGPDMIKHLQKAINDAIQVDRLGPHRREAAANVLIHVLETETVWYSDQAAVFVQRLDEMRRRDRLLSAAPWSPGNLTNAFTELFLKPDGRTSVLIPARRQPPMSGGIQTGESPSPDGVGILNYLNFAGNQHDKSPDRKVFDRMQEAFCEVSDGYRFAVEPDRANMLHLYFSLGADKHYRAQDCGLGLLDLLVLLYFAVHPGASLVLIEEPESHLHPEMQRKLLYFFKGETEKQFFLTTHTNVFLDNAFVDRVFFTSYADRVTVDDATGRASILDDLGYSVSDNLVSDLIILVEGPRDVGIVEEFLLKMGLLRTFNIKLWSLGGDIMDQQDLSVFAQHYSVVALLDQDPESRRVRERFEQNCRGLNILVHRLQRRAIENYLSVSALKEVFGSQMPSIGAVDPDKSLKEQLGFDVKRQNRRIAQAMALSDMDGTDFRTFLDLVATLCQQKTTTTVTRDRESHQIDRAEQVS